MSKKNKNRRSKIEFPHLDVKFNLKSRRDYMDSHYYVNGVKHQGATVIPPLNDKTKKWLDTFNKEYYNASFDTPWDYDGIHKIKVDKDAVDDIKDQIRAIKKERKKIFNKSPNTTTDADRALANLYNDQIEEMEDFLDEIHPRRGIENNNNARNRDLINISKASNIYDLVSWDDLSDDAIVITGLDDDEDY